MSSFDDAVIFATNAHSGQIRKDTKSPYVLHPCEVAGIISTITCENDTIIAGLLHDTIEDCGVTPEEIKNKFGENVCNLVMSETEDKLADLPPERTWETRKLQSLRVLRDAEDINVKILWLGDKLSNVRSFYRMYMREGVSFWNIFHQNNPKKQEWYYRKIAEYTAELKDTQAYKEYIYLINKIFEEV